MLMKSKTPEADRLAGTGTDVGDPMGQTLSLRCKGTNRAGTRCERSPIPGGMVCAYHGGRAPQTIEAAKRRLLSGVDLALDYLLAMLEPPARVNEFETPGTRVY